MTDAGSSIYDIVRDNWLLLLIGQYPNGPLGGIAATLHPVGARHRRSPSRSSVLIALARLSPWRLLRGPATALVYIVRGVPLLMIIFWVLFPRAAADRNSRPRLRHDGCARSSSTRPRS